MPVPSRAGLTNSGKFRSGRSASSPAMNSWKGATGRRRSRQMRLVSVLSSEMALVSTREPVYGIRIISRSAGTWASRASPPRPSAMLKQISGLNFFSAEREAFIGHEKPGLVAVAFDCRRMWSIVSM